MSRRSIRYTVYGDLDPLDPEYNLQVYFRIKDGGAYVRGRWVEAKSAPNGFWDKPTAKELVRYFAYEEKKWDRKGICEHLNTRVLRDNSLAGVCKQFNSSTFEIVSYSFPELAIEPWELASCPNAFWNEPENCAKAMRWLAHKEGIDVSREVFATTISARLLRKYGMGKAMVHMGGLYELCIVAYPEWQLKPWDLNKIGKITEEMVVDAVQGMIAKLGWSHEDVCEHICAKTFYDNGIGNILCKGCSHSPIIALQIAFPGEYERVMLRNRENPFK